MATKKKYKSKSQEEIKKELDQLIQHSMDKIKKYNESPEEVLEFTNFMSKIHNYSITNLFLIEDQFHGAQAVASYADWKKYGFQVQKGEKGIKIYAYTPYVMFIDEHGETKQLKEATPEQKEKIKNGHLKSKKIKSFKAGHVFDVSQTDATPEDLPKIFPNKVWNFNLEGENSLEQLEVGVKSLGDSLNININDMKESSFGEIGVARGAYAQYLNGTEEIVLNSRNTRTQNVSTSIHELAHKKLHNLDRIKDLPEDQKELGITNTEIKEFQAEMTSYIVCKNYGMDTSEKAIPYIAKWTKNGTKIDPKLTRAILTDVKNTASEFIENIDKTIIAEQERQQEQHQLKENDVKEIESNQQPKMAQKNSFENDQFKVDKEVMKDKLIEELKDIAEIEEILRINDDTYDYKHKQELILSERLRNLMKEANLPEDDFINLKKTFNVSTKLDLYETKAENDFQEVCEDEEEFKEFIEAKLAQKNSVENDHHKDNIKDFIGKSFNQEDNVLFKDKDLTNARFYDCEFKDLNLENVNLSRADFSNCVLDNVNAKGSNFNGVNIFKSEINNSNLENCDFSYAKLKHGLIKETNLSGVDFRNAEFNGEYLYDIEINNAPQNIESIYITMGGATHSEVAIYKENIMNILDKHDFTSGLNYKKIDALTKDEFSQENDIKITNYSLDEIVLDEFAYNLSEHASIYYDKDNWEKEIKNELDYDSISSLSSCEDPKQFYQEHKEEIEQTLSDLSKEKDMDIRSLIEPDNYKDMASLIAYKVALTSFQNEINNFTIPDHSVLEKPVEKEMEFKELSLRSQGMEME
ncbi:pentapeptide repeat-containing protein [Clostridium botulinum]|uniref:pentapeptide repeat-containing protein n=1 Tax=Clostridium botulinum TaxID=1491 RepID=UPI001C9BAC25|nr:pentapeptide repeat-containing protein [Clostridium botulinum]MBY6889350.1 pentapeptide repeat-containing protein [Clostridium botulinum]